MESLKIYKISSVSFIFSTERPVDQGKLKHFIDAINTEDVDTATRYAREFARDSATLELSLNSKNRNDTDAKNDSPKQEPLK